MPPYNSCKLLEFRVCSITNTCGLCTSLLVYLHDVFHVFGPSVQVRVKTTSVCVELWFPNVTHHSEKMAIACLCVCGVVFFTKLYLHFIFWFWWIQVWRKIICNKIKNCGASNLSYEKQLQTFYKIHMPNYMRYLIYLTCTGKIFLTSQFWVMWVSDDDKWWDTLILKYSCDAILEIVCI